MIEPQHEDQTRYTAPPDSTPDEPTYLLSQILRYVESLSPHPYNHHYTIEEIREILLDASRYLTDEETGIDTI
jgi:hypothetical protein